MKQKLKYICLTIIFIFSNITIAKASNWDQFEGCYQITSFNGKKINGPQTPSSFYKGYSYLFADEFYEPIASMEIYFEKPSASGTELESIEIFFKHGTQSEANGVMAHEFSDIVRYALFPSVRLYYTANTKVQFLSNNNLQIEYLYKLSAIDDNYYKHAQGVAEFTRLPKEDCL